MLIEFNYSSKPYTVVDLNVTFEKRGAAKAQIA